jgi:hypothetical protein
MAEEPVTETTQEKAAAAVDSALAEGQSASQGDISHSKTPASSAYSILQQERERAAAVSGRRPLFRGINLSGMGAQ